MPTFFPKVTGAFRIDEPPALRRFGMSVVAMAIVTGVVVRLYRLVMLHWAPNENLIVLGLMIALGLVFLFGMTTLHLGNFTVVRWLWRAPLFAILEAVVECLVSLLLIALAVERFGSSPATWADWPSMALRTLLWRVSLIVVFAAILAGVVQLVRQILLRNEARGHTLEAVQQGIEQEERTG